jgi:hypothetical protein
MVAYASGGPRLVRADDAAIPTPTTFPTVTIYLATPIDVPTVTILQPLPTRTAKRHPKKHHVAKKPTPQRTPTPTPVARQWIVAYLTSYCPGSAGWVSASGLTVFYGMLANNYYSFGTHVYIPAVGITGVVEDRIGLAAAWYHFDVWSPSCFSTPTGYFKVAVLSR